MDGLKIESIKEIEKNGREEAIKKVNAPCVILAGAGTGKTYTIVEKIKYLIGKKIYAPEKIVCITFSNEAANNLLKRVRKEIELANSNEPIIRTFHGFSADLLRKYGNKIGIDKSFQVLTPDEAKVILHKYLKVSVGNCHKYISSIGTAKDLGITIEVLREYLDRKLNELRGIDLDNRIENLQFTLKTLYLNKNEKWKKRELVKEIRKISFLLDLKKFINTWNAYEKLKKIKNYQDYSDLNKNALRLLKENKELSKDYDYIIVDEFQDINKIQLDLLFYLAPHGNITVVGDMNQSIYRFRGAYRKNFTEFKQVFNITNENIFNLDKSYRSTNKILRAAYHLILNNYTKLDECFEVLSVNNREGEKIEVYELNNAKEEARKVVELVENEIKKGIDMREICVMFRTHQQGRIIKRALELKKIPYVSVNKSSLLKEKSVKTVIDYLTILNKLKKREKRGEQAWWDLIYQLGFGKEDLIKIGRFIKENQDAGNLSAIMLSSLSGIELSDSGKMIAKILTERIKKLIPIVDKPVSDLIKEAYIIAGLINRQETKEEKTVIMNLNRFYDLAKDHSILHSDDLSSLLLYLDILSNLGIEIEAADTESGGIRLMTTHATKGLEYNTVIITNMAQKRFPIEHFNNNPLIPVELSPEFDLLSEDLSQEDLDYYIYEHEKKNQEFEERRLCYVAFTRSKEKLILTYANEYGGKKYYPSNFLDEVKYKKNPDFSFFVDSDERYNEPSFELKPIPQFISLLKNNNFDDILVNIAKDSDKLKENKTIGTFSPSSLLTFIECQKKYEYKYIYNMPEPKSIHWEAIMLGSFVHHVLEKGVKSYFKELKEFEDLAKEMHMEDDWENIDLNDALHLIKVFFARNKEKYKKESKTEIKLNTEIAGIKFTGFADRIDFFENGIEIIDYKTGKSNVPVLSRNWQLGYYALAASPIGKVKRITLDMLRHDKPLEFELDENGNARAMNSERMEGFNVYEIEQELIKTAHSVLSACENGFKACGLEKNCDFCNEWVYGL